MMKFSWKWTALNLLLLATIGCMAEDESAAPPKVAPVSPTTPKSATAKSDQPTLEMAPAATKSEAAPDPSKKSDDGPKLDAPKADNAKPADGASSLTAKQIAAIKLLPDSEQPVALKQLTCPVGGGPLGSMGKPVKVTYLGRSFYLCCDSCEEEVKTDPKAIIAKLDKK